MTVLMLCPSCKCDIAGKIRELPRQPVPEDYLLCYRCCQVSQFDKDMVLQLVPEDQIEPHAKYQREIFTQLIHNAKFVFAPPNQIH